VFGGTSDPQRVLMDLMNGFLHTQLLYAAVALGIPEALGGSPRSVEEIASTVDVDADSLRRLLRGLAACGITIEAGDEFLLGPVGELLRADQAASQRGAVLARGSVYYGATGALLDGLRRGAVPFEVANGASLFAYLQAHPDLAAAFDASMLARSSRESSAVVAALDLSRYHEVVDVGGGIGVLLEAMVAAAPHLHCVLFERPDVIERARPRLARSATAGRCSCVPGDFFGDVPEGGDLYVLSRVLHDWDDDAAVAILASCRRSMGAEARLVVVEAVLPERALDDRDAITMDLFMLILANGRERTAAEFEQLLGRAGFTFEGVTATPAGVSVIEAHPA